MQIHGRMIQAGTVERSDMMINDSTGKSVVTNLVQGSNISFSSTGGEGGTGAVTVNVISNPTFSGVINSGVTTGTSPFTIASTTVNTNLNADLLDGYHSSSFVLSSDSRLSNARSASDVYAWAKASTKPAYSASEVGASRMFYGGSQPTSGMINGDIWIHVTGPDSGEEYLYEEGDWTQILNW